MLTFPSTTTCQSNTPPAVTLIHGDSTTRPSDTGVPPPCHSDVLAVCLTYILLQQRSTKLMLRNMACGRSCAPPWRALPHEHLAHGHSLGSSTQTPPYADLPVGMSGLVSPPSSLTNEYSVRFSLSLCVASLVLQPALCPVLSFCSSSPVNLGVDLAPHITSSSLDP